MVEQKDTRDAFFDTLLRIARSDHNVLLLTADQGAWGVDKFREELEDQFINVGISEQNLISVCAGLALKGKKPFAYMIAAFIRRCYDQIAIDLCQMNLPVTVIGSGPGLSYGSDGPTHHATSDIVIMSALPNMTILTVQTQFEAERAADIAYENSSPVYVRLAKDNLPKQYGKYTDLFVNNPFEVHGIGD